MAVRWKSCFSVPHVLVIIGVFIVLRITWLSIHNMLHADDVVNIADQPLGHAFDVAFPPKECISGDNKSCVPVQPNDVYLGRGLYAHGSQFYLDGQPFRILSGSFHYFRTQPAQWGDRLMKIKVAGLNTVMTYVPWNLHEPVKGHYVFSGDWDVASFIKQAQKIGLKVILGLGPYISAEWEFGGLPSWLLADPKMKVRQSYEPYLKDIEEYFTKLLYVLGPLCYKKGGPVIAFQIENGYSRFGDDRVYTEFLLNQFKKWAIEELFFTSENVDLKHSNHGSVEGLLMAFNIMEIWVKDVTELATLQPGKPLLITGFGPHCCGHWSEPRCVVEDKMFETNIANILQIGASVNFESFVGGTNFGFWNGASVNEEGKNYAPSITSHDCDVPVTEHGSLTSKFFIVRRLMSQMISNKDELPDIATVANSTCEAYGVVSIEKWLPYKSVTDLAQDLNLARYDKNIILKQPVSMEELHLVNGCGQSRGWLLYRAEINRTDRLQILTVNGTVNDRAQFILDHKQIAVWYLNTNTSKLMLPPVKSGKMTSLLDIFVENLGRASDNVFSNQRKGILGSVHLSDGNPLRWLHIPLDFDEEFVSLISQHEAWQTYSSLFVMDESLQISAPALFMANLNLDSPPKDTFLDMKGWNKGIVIVNDFIIGRYWYVGPQMTLYVPASLLLQGRNTIIVFELHKPSNSITFVNKPNLYSQ